MPMLGEDDIRKLNAMWSWFKGMVQGGHLPQPQRVIPRGPDNQIVKVTSDTPTDDRYPGVIESYDSAAQTYTDGEVCWVVDVNGISLANGSRLFVRRTGDVSAVPTYLGQSVEASSGSITVREVDGSPSVGSVTTIEFATSGNGVSVADQGSNVARVTVAIASQSSAGVVSTAEQEFAGRKIFDRVRAVGDVTQITIGDYVEIHPDDYGDGANVVFNCPGSAWQGIVWQNANHGDTIIKPTSRMRQGDTDFTLEGLLIQTWDPSTPTEDVLLKFVPISNRVILSGKDASGYVTPKYSIRDEDGNFHDGATGTDANGNVFVGGICVSIA